MLTRLEFEYGGREAAAAPLNVQPQILRTLGRLSVKNDPVERRKVEGAPVPLTESEKEWIRAVLPKLVIQAARADSGDQPSKLTMADLPSL